MFPKKDPSAALGMTLRERDPHKFESRDEWLGIRDWGLGVTGDW